MEIYDYYTNTGEHKFGFKIYTTDDKTLLAYEAAGFDSCSAAEASLEEVLTVFA